MDGTYHGTDDSGHRVLYVPTPAAALRLSTVVMWARIEIAKPDADERKIAKRLEDQIARESPALLDSIKKVWETASSAKTAAWVSVLIAIIAVVLTSTQGISAEDLERILEENRNAPAVTETPSPPAQEDPMPRVEPLHSGQSDEVQES